MCMFQEFQSSTVMLNLAENSFALIYIFLAYNLEFYLVALITTNTLILQ